MPGPNIYLFHRLPKFNLNCLLDRKLPERFSSRFSLKRNRLMPYTGALEVIESNEIFGVQVTWFECFSGFISKEIVSPSWGKTLARFLFVPIVCHLRTYLSATLHPALICLPALASANVLALAFALIYLSVSISYSIFSFCMSVFPSIFPSLRPSVYLFMSFWCSLILQWRAQFHSD